MIPEHTEVWLYNCILASKVQISGSVHGISSYLKFFFKFSSLSNLRNQGDIWSLTLQSTFSKRFKSNSANRLNSLSEYVCQYVIILHFVTLNPEYVWQIDIIFQFVTIHYFIIWNITMVPVDEPSKTNI